MPQDPRQPSTYLLRTQNQHSYIPGRLVQTLGIATIIHFPSNIAASRWHNKNTDWTAFVEKVKEKITEVKTHHGWNRANRERDIKERYEKFIQIIKGKLEETTPKR
jgi:hypothetical protein